MYIDAEIAAGIAANIFVRNGGTVRNATTGAIVKHLDEAAQVAEESGLVAIVFDAAKKLPVGAKVAVVGFAVTGLLALSYQVVRAPVVNCAKAFRKSLEEYLESLATGVDVPDNLLKLQGAMKALRGISTTRKFSWVLSKKQADDLLRVLNEYTLKLAEANDVEVGSLPQAKPGEIDDLINEIELYLQAQARILDVDGQDDLKPNN